MKLSWIDYAIIFALMLVVAVVVNFAFPKSIEMDAESGKEVLRNNLFKVKAD